MANPRRKRALDWSLERSSQEMKVKNLKSNQLDSGSSRKDVIGMIEARESSSNSPQKFKKRKTINISNFLEDCRRFSSQSNLRIWLKYLERCFIGVIGECGKWH